MPSLASQLGKDVAAPASFHVRRLVATRIKQVKIAIALSVAVILPLTLLWRVYAAHYSRAALTKELPDDALLLFLWLYNNIAGLGLALYAFLLMPLFAWPYLRPRWPRLLPNLVPLLLYGLLVFPVVRFYDHSPFWLYGLYALPLFVGYFQFRCIFGLLHAEHQEGTAHSFALSMTAGTIASVFVVAVYTFFMPSIFLSTDSDLLRGIYRLVLHPLMGEVGGTALRVVARLQMMRHGAVNTEAFVLPLAAALPIFGRFLVGNLQTLLGQLLLSLLLALQDSLLRMTVSRRDGLIFYRPLYGRARMEEILHFDTVETGFGDRIVHQEEEMELMSILAAGMMIGLIKISADGTTTTDAATLVLVTAFGFFTEATFDIFSSAFVLHAGRSYYAAATGAVMDTAEVTEITASTEDAGVAAYAENADAGPLTLGGWRGLLARSYVRAVRVVVVFNETASSWLIRGSATAIGACLVFSSFMLGSVCVEAGLRVFCA